MISADPTSLLLLLAFIAVASYLQAVVGFGFGLLVMGLTASLRIMPLADTAIVISLLAMVNTATALKGGVGNILRREGGVSLCFSLPMIGAGLYILETLSASHTQALRLLLGITILASSTVVLRPPHREAALSPLPSFALFGVLSGLAGGMFSTGAPPVAFQFYRQPLPLNVIRDTLLGLFLVGSTARMLMVAASGGLTSGLLGLSALAFPLVILFSVLGRRHPPKLSERGIRRIVFALLVASALPLVAPG